MKVSLRPRRYAIPACIDTSVTLAPAGLGTFNVIRYAVIGTAPGVMQAGGGMPWKASSVKRPHDAYARHRGRAARLRDED